jgi:hypothetical protein
VPIAARGQLGEGAEAVAATVSMAMAVSAAAQTLEGYRGSDRIP